MLPGQANKLSSDCHHRILESLNPWRTHQGLSFMDAVCREALKFFLPEILLRCHFTDHCFSAASVPLPGKRRWGSMGLEAFYEREKSFCCLLAFQVKKLQRVGQYCDGTSWWWLGLIQSCDPRGKSLARTWTSASGKAFIGFRKEINLLTRRRKDLYPWCRDGIRRNYELTSE